MSIPSLLSHIGMHVPRGVTIDGRIIVGSEASHAIAQGTATAVVPHTFHGGDELADHAGERPWWENEARRSHDTAAVRRAFPGFELADSDMYLWRGVIDTGRGRFEISVAGSLAGQIPSITVERPRHLARPEGRRMRRAPHLYDSGRLCVAAAEDWDPERHTTATAVGWAAHWLAAYTEWRMSGHWPIPGYVPRAAR